MYCEKMKESSFINTQKNDKSVNKTEAYTNNHPLQFRTSDFVAIPELSKRKNQTGLPDNLKTGIENISGISMEDVHVHYNSPKPTQFQALAFTSGTDIHIGPGQEEHLPHEAWHVVQQKQGRVSVTETINGTRANTEQRLEQEADDMGKKALQFYKKDIITPLKNEHLHGQNMFRDIVQMKTEIKRKPGESFNLKKIDLSPDKCINHKFNVQSESGYQRGYIGTSIVYSLEKGASDLAKKYAEQSNAWSEKERSARLGVSFVFNHNNLRQKKDDSNAVTNVLYSHIWLSSRGISNYMEFVKWCVSFKYGDIDITFNSFEDLFDKYEFYKSSSAPQNQTNPDSQVSQTKASTTNLSIENPSIIQKELNTIAMEHVPYGLLRTKATDNALELKSQIEENLKPARQNESASTDTVKRRVYIHSVDTDAPSFETENKLKVLNAYDNILNTGAQNPAWKDPAFLIGGYNLGSKPDDMNDDDYFETVFANYADRIVRKGIYDKTGMVVYPTEPNFLFKAKTYKKLKNTSASPAWGTKSSEGYNLLLKYLSYRKKRKKSIYRKPKDKLTPINKQSAILYDDNASIPTGLDAGGKRLRVYSGKKVSPDIAKLIEKLNKNLSVFFPIPAEGVIPIGRQYAVQAQSWVNPDRIYYHWKKTIEAMPLHLVKTDNSEIEITAQKLPKNFEDNFINYFSTHLTVPLIRMIETDTIEDIPTLTENTLFKSLVAGIPFDDIQNNPYKGMVDFDGMINEIWHGTQH